MDVVAADADDLRGWKGWVQSRLRQLILEIEQDTGVMLQCRRYPKQYVDPSKQCAHCAFFMALRLKQGVKIQKGQPLDIRGTIKEFMASVSMYAFWKSGMNINVSHVARKQIPSYVFPSRPTSHQRVDRTPGGDATEELESCAVGQQQSKEEPAAALGDIKPEKPLTVPESCRMRIVLAEFEVGSVKMCVKRSNSGDCDGELERPRKRASISQHH